MDGMTDPNAIDPSQQSDPTQAPAQPAPKAAPAPDPLVVTDEPMEDDSSEDDKKDFYDWALLAFAKACTRWTPQWEAMTDDLRFLAREHWPQSVIQARGSDKPTPVFDLTSPLVQKVENEVRENLPGLTIRRTDADDNQDLAELLQGHIRSIEQDSHVEKILPETMRYSCSCGLGWLFVDYVDDEESFEPKSKIKYVDDPTMVAGDPDFTSEDDLSYVFWFRGYSEEHCKEKWGEDIIPVGGMTPTVYLNNWSKGEKIYIAECWRLVDEEDELLELAMLDGTRKTVWASEMADDMEADPQSIYKGAKINKKKKGKRKVIKYALMSGAKVVTLCTWPGSKLPLVPVFGRSEWTSNGRMYSGLVRPMIDPQRMYNYYKAQEIQTVALTPQVPIIVSRGSIDANRGDWNVSNVSPKPYLEIDGWDKANNRPHFQPFRLQNNADAQALIANQKQIESVIGRITGVMDVSMGENTQDISGKAITARSKVSDSLNMQYYCNLQRSYEQVGRILIDRFRATYKAGKKIESVNEKGERKTAVLSNRTVKNPDTGKIEVFDITDGSYAVTVQAGPSYRSLREEAAAAMQELLQYIPEAQRHNVLDMVVAEQDWPNAQAMAKRLAKMVDPMMRDSDSNGESDPAAEAILSQYQQEIQAQQQAHQQTLDQLQQTMQTVQMLQGVLDGQEARAQAQIEAAVVKATADIQIQRMKMGQDIATTQIEQQGELAAQQAEHLQQTRNAILEKALNAGEQYIQGIGGGPSQQQPMAQAMAGMNPQNAASLTNGSGALQSPASQMAANGAPSPMQVPAAGGINPATQAQSGLH